MNNNKKSWWKKEKSRSHILWGLAIFFVFLNAPFIADKILAQSQTDASWIQLLSQAGIESLGIITIAYGSLLLGAFHRIFFKFWASLLIISTSIATFYFWDIGIIVNDQVIIATFFTTMNEAKEVFSFMLIVWVLFLGIVPSTLLWITPIKKLAIKKPLTLIKTIGKNGLALAIITFAFLFFSNSRLTMIATFDKFAFAYYPTSPIAYGFSALRFVQRTPQYNALIDLPEAFAFKVDKPFPEGLRVVLFIGESVSGEHLSLNGYHKETNPEIHKIKNLVSFTKATSCYPGTWGATVCLTGMDKAETFKMDGVVYKNIFSVFNAFGFQTHWISTAAIGNGKGAIAPMGAKHQRYYADYARKASANAIIYDNVMQPDILNVLKDPSTQPHFMVIQGIGSHHRYPMRYPKEYSYFTPDCHEANDSKTFQCSEEKLINAYDNSIRYTDEMLAVILKTIEESEKPMLFLYASDHDKTYNTEKTIGFYFYTNKAFENYYGFSLKALEAHRHAPISHDNIFSTLLDCTGFSGIIVEQSLSLCRMQ